jgi:hypothetical protein
MSLSEHVHRAPSSVRSTRPTWWLFVQVSALPVAVITGFALAVDPLLPWFRGIYPAGLESSSVEVDLWQSSLPVALGLLVVVGSCALGVLLESPQVVASAALGGVVMSVWIVILLANPQLAVQFPGAHTVAAASAYWTLGFLVAFFVASGVLAHLLWESRSPD